jgi:hypothetical protein
VRADRRELGTALYVDLTVIGNALIALDDHIYFNVSHSLEEVLTLPTPPVDTLVWGQLSDGEHTLVIGPSDNATTIEMDKLIYTCVSIRPTSVPCGTELQRQPSREPQAQRRRHRRRRNRWLGLRFRGVARDQSAHGSAA